MHVSFTFFSRVVIIKIAAVFSALLCFIAGPGMSDHADLRAQYLDPYRRINDPLAIADLGGPDSLPLWHQNFAGPDGPLDYEGFHVMAGDTGVGIIRNLWAAYNDGNPPPTGLMKLWVDDSLIVNAERDGLFEKTWGSLRPPMDTFAGGAYNMDVQIPYKHSFRWTSQGYWFFRAASWQRIDTSVQKLPTLGSSKYSTYQDAAEAQYSQHARLPANAVSIDREVEAGGSRAIANLNGPGSIDGLEFLCSGLDSSTLRNLWLEVDWDNSPVASVNMPLTDFFGLSLGWRNIHSFFMDVDSSASTLRCRFAMPYRVSARVTLVNRNHSSVSLHARIAYHMLPSFGNYGYFGASHVVTDYIPLHVRHHALHVDGRGKYIGLLLTCTGDFPDMQTVLEGDTYVLVDSIPYKIGGVSCHYTGIEDYCNGGWYFNNTPYSQPFYGCPNWWHTVYRFQVNDAYNFTTSLDVNIAHGFNEDLTVTMSSVAFYYTDWTPFYPSVDTIAAGNRWMITGAGYRPGCDITVKLGANEIYRGRAAGDGTIAIALTVPVSWPVGRWALSVNGVQRPTLITMLDAPKLLFVQDSAGTTFSESDSIEVRAYGFRSGEELRLFADDSSFGQNEILHADSSGIVRTKVFLPWLPEGLHRLDVHRSNGDLVYSDSSFYVTRTLSYEFELLRMTEGQGDRSYLSYADWHFSQASIIFCNGNWHTESHFSFQFDVPFADSFDVTLFAITSNRYCAYRTYIDGVDRGVHDWFRYVRWAVLDRDSAVMPNVYLTKGTHTIRFVTDSWHDSTVEYSIGPDNMHLKPLSPTSQAEVSHVGLQSPSFSFYPDPVTATSLHLTGLSDSASEIMLFDGLGREVFATPLTINAPNQMVALPLLSDGQYWLRVIDGKLQITKPITILRWQ